MSDWWENLSPQARMLWSSLLFVAVLLVGAMVLLIVDRWRRWAAGDQSSTNEQMTSFRSLYERGELSREEYERIRNRLGGRLRQEMKVPKPPVPPPAPNPPDPPEAPEGGSQPS